MRDDATQLVDTERKESWTYVRLINVSSPPMSLTIVDIECGAKKLISHEDAE